MEKRKHFLKNKWAWISALGIFGLGIWLLAPACRFSALGVWAVCGVIFCYWLLARLGKKCPKGTKACRRIFTTLLCLLLLAMAVTEGFILSAAKGGEAVESPYLLVLGAGVDGTVPSLSLTERLRAAEAYLNAHPETVCIVSGGQGGGEDISEARCMYNWLTNHGIGAERIIMEDKATSTAENLAYSLEILREMGEDPQEIAVVSSEYHLFRAGLMAKEAGITALGVPARTSLPLLRLNYYFREIFGVWYFLIFGK